MIKTFRFENTEIRPTDNGFVCPIWEISSAISFFNGHFPQNPVLPAVAIVDASVVFLNTQSRLPLTLLKVESAKFSQPLSPGQKVQIRARHLKLNEWGTSWDVEWLDAASLEVTAQLRLCVAG